MNPMQMLMNQLKTQVKAKNPQIFQQFQNLVKNQNNPSELLNQMTSNYTPEQMKQFRQFANGFGITDEQLNKFGINSKKS
jgi:hypothetical protein